MLKYFQTTTLILLWCFCIAMVWGVVVFHWTAWRKSRRGFSIRGSALLPSLVLGPLFLVVAFRALGINLLFPIHFFSDLSTLMVAAVVPAFVLVLASGLLTSVGRGVQGEYQFWTGKMFTTVARASGVSETKVLRRLVLTKSMVEAWTRCLPWLFGELIVVESVFNAPGLGLDAWHLARVRDFEGLAYAVLSLALLYGFCVALSAWVHRRLGRRLESYG